LLRAAALSLLFDAVGFRLPTAFSVLAFLGLAFIGFPLTTLFSDCGKVEISPGKLGADPIDRLKAADDGIDVIWIDLDAVTLTTGLLRRDQR
jgi:hypothetical protein